MIRASASITAGQPEAALADYRRAMEVIEAIYGPDHTHLVHWKMTASAGLLAIGRVAEATELAKEAEALLARQPRSVTPDLAQTTLNLGVTYAANREYAKAKDLLARARVMTLQLLGPDHPDLALIDANVASLWVGEGDFATAARLAREATVLMDRTTPSPHEARGQLFLVKSEAAAGLKDLKAAIVAAEAAAAEYPAGDERKILSLVTAAMYANDHRQGTRALAILAVIDTLPVPTDPQLLGRIPLERARALILGDGDRKHAAELLDEADTILRAAELTSWVDKVGNARAKLIKQRD